MRHCPFFDNRPVDTALIEIWQTEHIYDNRYKRIAREERPCYRWCKCRWESHTSPCWKRNWGLRRRGPWRRSVSFSWFTLYQPLHHLSGRTGQLHTARSQRCHHSSWLSRRRQRSHCEAAGYQFPVDSSGICLNGCCRWWRWWNELKNERIKACLKRWIQAIQSVLETD
jgi:hypothetical protein